MKRFFLILLFSLFSMPLASAPVVATEASLPAAPSAQWQSLRYEFAPVVDGTEVVHDFVFTNTGTADLEIQKVKTA